MNDEKNINSIGAAIYKINIHTKTASNPEIISFIKCSNKQIISRE